MTRPSYMGPILLWFSLILDNAIAIESEASDSLTYYRRIDQSEFARKERNFSFFFFILFAVCTPHAEYYILFWRGVRGCLNNFSGCYCKIWKL